MKLNSNNVVVADYGMGNIRSLVAAVEHLGHTVTVSGIPDEISKASTLILPGVGSFPAAMTSMNSSGIARAVLDAHSGGTAKILGICLGMQLLMEFSHEDGGSQGLGLVTGQLDRFSATADLRVPHIGFNSVQAEPTSRLFSGLESDADFYFVHSFRALPSDAGGLHATCRYGEEFVAAFEIGNVFGTQFHPEKSQGNGLRLLRNFFALDLV